jgi:hypothetical protein
VKRENRSSLAAFEMMGFVSVATLRIAGHDSVRMAYPAGGSEFSKGE